MKIAALFLAVSSVFGFSNAVSAQCGPDLAQGKPTVISLSLSADNESFKVGSPVIMRVDLKNKSGHDLFLGLLAAPGEDLYSIEVHNDKGEVPIETEHGKLHNGHVPVELLKPKNMNFSVVCVPLKAGEIITHGLNLSKVYNFERPGKYEIQVQRADAESLDFVKSNKVTITVTP
jgi:hypothetical protein